MACKNYLAPIILTAPTSFSSSRHHKGGLPGNGVGTKRANALATLSGRRSFGLTHGRHWIKPQAVPGGGNEEARRLGEDGHQLPQAIAPSCSDAAIEAEYNDVWRPGEASTRVAMDSGSNGLSTSTTAAAPVPRLGNRRRPSVMAVPPPESAASLAAKVRAKAASRAKPAAPAGAEPPAQAAAGAAGSGGARAGTTSPAAPAAPAGAGPGAAQQAPAPQQAQQQPQPASPPAAHQAPPVGEASAASANGEAPAGQAAPPPQAAAAGKAEGAAAAPAATTGRAEGPEVVAAQPPPPPDPWAKAREEATAAARQHDPAATVKGREYWLYLTAPEPATSGAECVLYFNRAQSEPLKTRPRVQLHIKFNAWELDSPGGDRLDMAPAPVSRAEGVDFWRVSFTIPPEAYEMNFIFGDGEGTFDNNGQQNYLLPVSGPMTRDLWIDTAGERAAAAYAVRKEAERAQRQKEEEERELQKQQQDVERARESIRDVKGGYFSLREGAAKATTGANDMPLWRTAPETFSGGGKVRIQYNRKASPLHWLSIPDTSHLNLRIGYNGWRDPHLLEMVRVKQPPAGAVARDPAAATTGAAAPAVSDEEEWWEAEYEVPLEAVVLNFVVNYFEHWDNNQQRDYKVLVDLPKGYTLTERDIEAWADSLEQPLTQRERAARKAEEAAAAEREARRRAQRLAVQEHSEEVRRRQMRHVLFTDPVEIRAGEEVDIYYNPNNTLLAGSGQVFLRGGWNRWRHPRGFGPVEMVPPAVGDHFRARVKVPKDAYFMDFVFSNAEEGGAFDNRGGLDYHLPVEGSVVEEPPLYVCHIAVEMAPICKVGGLGDVVTSLGRAVQEQGHQVEVVLPRYAFFSHSPLLSGLKYETEFDWNGTKVFVTTCMVEGLRVYFLEPGNGTFNSQTVYLGREDQGRFEYFSRCALEFLLRTGRQPDILHCHDWSSADVAKYYWTEYHNYGLWKPNVVFTIHNLEFGAQKLGEAAYFSQRFTTVSPTYAFEIGGNPIIAPNAGKLMGIRNGIDIDIWDPETDPFLPLHYTAENVAEGKAAARQALRRRVNLSEWGDKPLVGVVSRLTAQKGIHLIKHAAWRTLDRSGQFVLLGSAPDPRIQADFQELAQSMGGQDAAFCFAFDEPLSHLIYAACDFILVPSMFEPCGLTQMIAMRYGAIPVVRSTGGLHDTVFDVDTDKARAAWEMEGLVAGEGDGSLCTNGFSFEGTDEGALDYALNRALDAWYNDRAWTRSMQQRVMRQDWSWNKPAIDYIELYYAALK